MEDIAYCRVHPERPAEYVCPTCKNRSLCETCKQRHEARTRHALENCKKVGLAIMHQCIQDASGRQANELAKGLRKGLKKLKTGLLREIDRFQLSCMPTEELRDMKKLDIEGRYAELYFYAKGLPKGVAKNKAATGKLKEHLLEILDITSNGLKKVLSEFAVAKRYKPIFAAYNKDEMFALKGESYKKEEQIISVLHSADMPAKVKAVYIYPWCDIGDRVASELASRLQTHPVSALYLNGRHISDAGANALAQAAFRGKSLSAFCIWGSRISNIGAKAVAEAARGSRSLTTFELYSWGISDSGAIAVAEAVKDCPLSVFYLSCGMISDAGAIAVAKTMKSCPLTAFCLGGYEISDAAAISVAKTMKDCPLSAFYLGSGGISDAGATAVAETLSSGECASTLSAFYLGSNGISDSGAKNVADAVRGCTSLSEFYLDGAPTSGETMAHILESMAGISTILSVNLCISEIIKVQMDSCLNRLQNSGIAKQFKLLFQCDTEAAKSVCNEFEAEWNAKLAGFRIVPTIDGLFMDDVIIGMPK
ncbi:MAG: hypothetical protein P4L50_21425 [Anaerolineaceae bacterium]|nr:hypothetical protein [Anaerolineaceae bacterium]